jgi:hypothetical protein
MAIGQKIRRYFTMIFEVRNLFKKEIADQVCETLGLKPNALIEPMVGKGNYRIVGTEDRLELRTNKVRILHSYYSDRAERARMEEMQRPPKPRVKEEEVSIDVSRKALRSYYGNAGQKRFFGRKT